MASLPKGVFGGTLEGHPDGKFILVATARPQYSGVFAFMFRGPDLLSASPGVNSITQFTAQGVCSDLDRRMYNGSDGPFNADIYDAVYVNATLDPSAHKVSGTLRYLEGAQATYRLSGGPIPGTNYEPAASPVLTDIAGDWSMVNANGQALQLSVASDGKVAASLEGCPITGSAQADGDGLNLFSVRLKLATPPCLAFPYTDQASMSISGFALVLPLAGANTQLLLWAEADNGWGPVNFILASGRR